ncbi:hypothetical protein SteCoe_24883 [Stentor coeruleus]|uniref:Uncharacterized protein n=1 Tax=Stentor coeruleus TaxID=5963 RepID=A0A1R2BGL1_9CILI|nr:hypothetical protein SteCoe_24883 [Stentor coeruleus]
MSKVKKVITKKFPDQRMPSHYTSFSLLSSQQSLGNLAQQPEKSENYSESPYGHKMTKVRSTSIIKEPSLYHPSGMISPPLNPKFTMNLKSKFNLSTSFISKVKETNDSNAKTKKKPIVVVQRKSFDNDAYMIELRLEELVTKHKENGISSDLFDKYREILEEIIFKDRIYGTLLSKIKFAYEDWLKSKSLSYSETTQLKSEIVEFSKKLTEEIEENKRLHRKVQKFSKENVDLGRALEEKETNFRTLQEYLLKITNITIDDIPQDKASWKVMVAENKSYSELCDKLKKKIKNMKIQDKKLMTLFWMLKQKGYPVEEIYESLGSKKNKKKKNLSISEFSDELINAEPVKGKPRPGVVPVLNMEKVEPNSFSDDKDSESGEIDISY